MSETIYPKGIRTFAKNEKSPDFVLGTVIISLKEFYDWIKDNPQLLTDYNGANQLKLQCLKKKDGGITFTVDTYKPKEKPPIEVLKEKFDAVEVDDLPF